MSDVSADVSVISSSGLLLGSVWKEWPPVRGWAAMSDVSAGVSVISSSGLLLGSMWKEWPQVWG